MTGPDLKKQLKLFWQHVARCLMIIKIIKIQIQMSLFNIINLIELYNLRFKYFNSLGRLHRKCLVPFMSIFLLNKAILVLLK